LVQADMTTIRRLTPLVALALSASPTAALAVGEEGTGENVRHVRNIQYPNLHSSATSASNGTDVEFATMTFTQTVQAKKKPSKRDTTTTTEKRFAFAGSYADGLQIIDITDPENATLVSTWDCGVSQGDV